MLTAATIGKWLSICPGVLVKPKTTDQCAFSGQVFLDTRIGDFALVETQTVHRFGSQKARDRWHP
jgi:hypothetical protein